LGGKSGNGFQKALPDFLKPLPENGRKWPFLGQTSARFLKSSGWFGVNFG